MAYPLPARARRAAVLNGTVTLALIVLVAVTALIIKPPAPPSIAEFAPQAARPITQAPQQQSSTNGSGSGACLDGAVCASPSPRPSALAGVVGSVLKGVPSALQCYTWPDGSVTQTFDPQSPPCVPNWPEADKGNGGATAPGVTANAVRVVVDIAYSNQPERFQVLADFFNNRFQLYGRKIVLQQLDSTKYSGGSSIGESDPSVQKAMAVGARSFSPFAATGLTNLNTIDPTIYLNNLSDAGIVTADSRTGAMTSGDLRTHPNTFVYNPPSDVMERNLAQLVCNSLPARANAEYAGSDTRSKERKFAVLLPDDAAMQTGAEVKVQVAPLLNGLASCGTKAQVFEFSFGPGVQPTSTNAALMANLKANGYTSLIFFGASAAANTGVFPAAEAASFHPEWILPGTVEQDTTTSANFSSGPKSQSSHMFGIAPFSRTLASTAQPWARAYKEQSGGYLQGGFNQMPAIYHELQIIASGIQAAGPRLTPQTFRTALENLDFPNPGGAAAPDYQATVGFLPDEHWMTRDLGAWWYSTDTTPIEEGGYLPGKMCLAEGGRRWSDGHWPRTRLAFFRKPCP